MNRRHLLKSTSSGFGYLAFAALAHEQAMAEGRAKNPLAPRAPHHPPRAKRVIFLNMPGAPSHLDTFDYKPQLAIDHGKPGKYGNMKGSALMASPWEFQQHGRSGLWISDLFPHLAQHADDLCLLRGMHTDNPNHSQAQTQLHTGSFQFVRPSIGAWSLYGLGSEAEGLPGFISLNSRQRTHHGNAFLPAAYQGTAFRSKMLGLSTGSAGEGMMMGGKGRGKGKRGRLGQTDDTGPAIPNIANPRLDPAQQRAQLDLIQALNRDKLAREIHQPDVEGVIGSFELGFQMQDTLPRLFDLSKETPETLALYGIGQEPTDTFGKECLLARRMAEAGVRFIKISHGSPWDHHGQLREKMAANCAEIDQPIAGLLQDLKRRDLLKDTLVLWGGEFGRTPHGQGSNADGRDHNVRGFTTWMAGGGVKGGLSYGSTDPHGYEAVEDKMHIHDWHATILHLLGLDHERLTYRHAGRDFRLTDVHGKVATDILA